MASLWERLKRQIDMGDNGATFKNPAPASTPAPKPMVGRGVLAPRYNPAMQPRQDASLGASFKRVGTQAGLGAVRSLAGAAQGVSGLVDLATPGVGTSRISKGLDSFARTTDATAKLERGDRNYLGGAYKLGQATTDVASFAAPSAALKLAGRVPGVARTVNTANRITQPISRPVANLNNRVISNVASKGPGGRIAATGLRQATNPGNILNMAAGTGLDLGAEASKGRDISRGDVALSVGANVGMGVGLPMLAKGTGEVARKARQAAFNSAAKPVKAQNIPTSKLSGEDIQGYGDLDPVRVSHYKNEITNGRPIEPIIAMKSGKGIMPVEDGKHRLQAYKELGITNIPTKVVTSKELKRLAPSVGMSSKMVDSEGNPTTWAEVKAKRGAPQVRPDAEQRVFEHNPMSPANSEMQRAALQADSTARPSQKLPEFKTSRVGALDKAFRSTRSIIERQGQSGKQLADLLRGQRDTQELFLGDTQKAMPTVMELARKGRNALINKDFENFVDATQGLVTPKNAKIAKAVQEWQATHPGIRDRAVKAGLDVGDLGPQYYPHFIDYDHVFKDKNTYNAAINHLVESGQAPNPEEAIKLLTYARDVSRNRQFGNLEASRLVDLPFYDKTPNSLISYLNGSAKRISQTETFGAKDENALKLIAQAGQEGYDTEAMKNAYDVAVGAKQYNPTSDKFSSGIRKYVTTTRLGLGALTNVSQNVNTGIVTGHMRTLGAMAKQLDPKTREFVADTGTISDALLNDIKTQSGYSSFSSKVFGKAVNKVTAPFFGTVEKFNRSVAATAGRDYALRLAQKGDEATLRKLGVKGPIKGTLTINQQVQAARAIVEKTQFKVDPQDLPGWADSPGGKLVSQFRTFSYNQGKFFSNEILKPAAKGNLMPLGRLMAALPMGYALYETKRVIGGRPEEENKTKVGQQAFQNVGGAGLAFDLYNGLNPIGSQYLPSDRRVSMAAGAFGGPAVGVGMQGIGALSELVQRKNTPVDQERLEGKIALGKGDTYTDATPAARFAIQQVPIVGTPIKNRVLPFKRESEADTGKTSSDTSAKPSSKDQKAAIANAFTTKDGKAMLALKSDDEREEQYPDLFREYKAMKKAFSGSDSSKGYNLLDDQAKSLANRRAKLTDEGKEGWLKQEIKKEDKNLYDRASKIAPKDFPPLPQTNSTLDAYDKYLRIKGDNPSRLKLNNAKREFLKTAYSAGVSEEAKEVRALSSNDFRAALASGVVDKNTVDEAIELDNLLVNMGLSHTPGISNKVRKEYGYSTVGSTSGGGKGSKSPYSFSAVVNAGTKANGSLRQLLANARVS